MAGKPGDVPLNGSDNNENVLNEETRAAASDALRQDAYKPNEVSQRLEKTETWDPKAIEEASKAIEATIKSITDRFFTPDKSGTSWIERMASVDSEAAKNVQAQFNATLKAPFEQTSGEIKDLMKKLRSSQ